MKIVIKKVSVSKELIEESCQTNELIPIAQIKADYKITDILEIRTREDGGLDIFIICTAPTIEMRTEEA